MPSGIAEKDADLAVLDAPGRAGVLALHTDRMGALLHKAGLVQHQHAIGITEVLDDIGT